MSPLDVFAAIAKGTEVATSLARVIGIDRETLIRVAAAEVHRLHAAPPDQAGDWRDVRRELLGDADELERHDTDRIPPPRSSNR